ncbi:MAG: NMD3-related protein [Candidatus Aenigmatarchaeota archaeon]|nr:60S ribosomal export protein NMD3 [Candidatus Aenigmarchaeota archaeon]
MKICYKCGKEAFKENLCKDHYIENILPSSLDIQIIICKKCNKIFYHNRWSNISIEKIIKNSLRLKNKIKINKINIKIPEIEIIFFLPELNQYIKKNFKLKIIKKLCKDCLKILGGYYEAVFQFRGKIPEWAINYIKSNEDFIKLERKKEGLDFYILKRSSAEKISKYFMNKNCEIKKSFKLITRKDGRDVYRFFYCIKF